MVSQSRSKLTQARRWVVKLGSALLTGEDRGLQPAVLQPWVKQVYQLRQLGHEVIIVSSGATTEGMKRLGWQQRPGEISKLQAAAAVGQMGLITAWESCFEIYDIRTAQILLTHGVIANRDRYLNARNTLRALLELGVIPIVNENDTVATEELQFGDNDTLASLVTNLVDAELLVLLTDQQGLYDADPRYHSDPKLIHEAMAGDKSLKKYAGKGSALGRGGMLTKLDAAAMAARSGASTVIASGLMDNVLLDIAAGKDCGTLLNSQQESLTARKQWLAGRSQTHGMLRLDQGAVDALLEKGKSLLAVGVISVKGDFRRGEMVSCTNPQGVEIARGLVNYDARETAEIAGHSSEQFEKILGYASASELIHRDDLILL